MPMVISAPSTKLPSSPTPSRGPDSATSSPPAGTSFSRPASMTSGGQQQRRPHPDLDGPPGQPADHARAQEGAQRRGGDQQHQGHRVHLDDRDVDQRLGDDRDHVPDHQRARDQLIGHHPEQPEQRGGRGERSDPQRVEEVGHEADAQLRRWGGRSDSAAVAAAPAGPAPAAVPPVRRTPRTAHRIRRGPPATGRAGPSSGAILTTDTRPATRTPVFREAQSGVSSRRWQPPSESHRSCWLRRCGPRLSRPLPRSTSAASPRRRSNRRGTPPRARC